MTIPIGDRTCIHCGKVPAEDRKWLCDHCGLPFMPPEPPGPPAPIVVWSYPGRTQVDAGQVYAKHAVELAAQGYVPIAQSWAEGRPGGGRVFMLGVFATAIRPKGFLTVTYRLEPPKDDPQASQPDPIEQINRLGQLRDNGLITAEEFETKKADLLARM